ncbi:hypothetical protein RIF29_40934 [Crotalaria pallida]|uniref:non-specific serine/threonine protein kinase n=1 Tax=Crotalaria pallida TaxID=3830 RepID=A0AAN9HR46_CROPI
MRKKKKKKKVLSYLFPSPTVCITITTIVIVIMLLLHGPGTDDYTALQIIKQEWQNTPPSWENPDPCDDGWEGIRCNNSRVIIISLASNGLTGEFSTGLALLSELVILDLSYNDKLTGQLPHEIGNLKKLTQLLLIGCGFRGQIPDTIGNLERLRFLALNNNSFSGIIPASIGKLSNLKWLDLAENQLVGSIPVSNGDAPGLDMLQSTEHFHFGKNNLSGNIPPQLFSSEMSLKHVLFDSNKLNGTIPSTLGLVQSVKIVRFDYNFLNGSVPPNINNLTKLTELYLSNNQLSGPLPNLTGMVALNYLDMSNSSFAPSEFPLWSPSFQSLTTIKMEHTNLQGSIPASIFSLPHLQTVVLKDNMLNGTLDIGTTISSQLELLDLQHNSIVKFNPLINVSKVTIILVENPFCQNDGEGKSYCSVTQQQQPNNDSNTAPPPPPPNNCAHIMCNSDQTLSPKCQCDYPYSGTLIFRAPAFSGLGNKSDVETYLNQSFQSYGLPVDSFIISNPRNVLQYLMWDLEMFPPLGQNRFNRTGISSIGYLFSSQTFSSPPNYGPHQFAPNYYGNYMNDTVSQSPVPSGKSSNTGIIAGAAGGGSILLVLSFLAIVYTINHKKNAKGATGISNSFEEWDPNESDTSVPHLKGARRFTFEEIQNYTKNFAQANNIGSGGYGKVYRGTLQNGQLIAVKRAQRESMQGGVEFKTEIELLSRVHHKNLVSLLGFCFGRGEQMLIYEYVVNGTLKDTLSGKSGIRLDWIRRLKVVLGAARGLDYLHEHANPPIIHRDIKSTNILLDERLNAKVSDFGLSKPLSDGAKGYITTQVKGTMGYLDPEYYMTQQLTEKSDVYSFGVLMLEVITARRPIERGKYIVKVVKTALDKKKDLYGLREILDPTLGLGSTLIGFEKFVDIALQCVEESSSDRPSMNHVVKEIENILQLAGANPSGESPTTSSSYDLSKGSSLHPYDNEYFDSSVVLPRP